METRVLLVEHPIEQSLFAEAGTALANGRIVAFPTETVYGLGASAYLPASVREIFRLKGRPSDNPLIVHLLSADDLEGVVSSVPPAFRVLYDAFSPGPLTYVMPRGERIPPEVSAGLPTVAVRFPSQPAARALIAAAGVPVVAPSANVSGRPSPTRARHVLDDFAGQIPWVIDDGPCEVGLESTVIDLTSDPIRILRPGVVTAEAILMKTGIEVVSWKDTATEEEMERPPAPGMKYRHYAPKAEVHIVLPEKDRSFAGSFLEAIRDSEARTGVFFSESTWNELRKYAETLPPALDVYTYEGERDLTRAARFLFDAMRTFDERGVEHIYAEGFEGDEAAAYMDRLTHAAGAADDRIPEAGTEAGASGGQILFICEGNTCRSPMAEALFNDRFGGTIWRAASAGLSAVPGWPVSDQTLQALREFGIEAEGKVSKPVDLSMLKEAKLVVTMTTGQRERLREAAPAFSEKIISMADISAHARDIADPFGEGMASYRRVRDQINESLEDLFSLLQQR